MNSNLTRNLDWIEHRINRIQPIDKVGKVVQVTGLIIESEGPEASLGDVCEIHVTGENMTVASEVVGFRDNRVLLMPLEDIHSLHPGCLVVLAKKSSGVPVGEGLVGRVIDGLGRPIDGLGPLLTHETRSLTGVVPNPMLRRRISEPFQTGVRSIDSFTPMGLGQRIGIFAGSGVGKSTLLGMIARGSDADINVIALIGERGRELREFIETDLGKEGISRSVVVVATSDQPAPLRLRAAQIASSIAEYFRDGDRKVLLLMDSLTRFAMAQREIGLAIGEPPTSRGYTPSVFSKLPRLLERSGMGQHGSITALYTVLVEGDDLNEPISDAVRGILDGHIVLSRSLATANRYPPVDVLESVSRLSRIVCSEDELATLGQVRELLALYRRNEDLINIGAYVKGNNSLIDRAIEVKPALDSFLSQKSDDLTDRAETFKRLREAVA